MAKSRKRRSRKRTKRKRKRKRRRRGGVPGGQQLLAYPIVPAMRFDCPGMFSNGHKACKAARSQSKSENTNEAYCKWATPGLEAFVQKNSGKCFSDMKTKNKLKWQNEWQRAANAKCISDEAVCPTNYPGKGYRAPKMPANIDEAEEKMGGKFGIFTGIVKDFGGDKNRAFAWLQDKQTKEMAMYQKMSGSTGGRKSRRRRKSKRRKRKTKRRRSRRR